MVGVLGFCTTPGSYVQNHRIFPGFYARSDTGWLNPNVGCRLDNREEGHHARVLQWNVGVARQHGACSIPVTPRRQDHHLSGCQRDCRRLQEELLTKRCAHSGCASSFVVSGHRARRPLAGVCSCGTTCHPGIEAPPLFCGRGIFRPADVPSCCAQQRCGKRRTDLRLAVLLNDAPSCLVGDINGVNADDLAPRVVDRKRDLRLSIQPPIERGGGVAKADCDRERRVSARRDSSLPFKANEVRNGTWSHLCIHPDTLTPAPLTSVLACTTLPESVPTVHHVRSRLSKLICKLLI